jgi:hypothetical protein
MGGTIFMTDPRAIHTLIGFFVFPKILAARMTRQRVEATKTRVFFSVRIPDINAGYRSICLVREDERHFHEQSSIDALGCLQPANSQMSASAGVPNKRQLHFNKTSKAKSSYLDQFRAGLNLRTLQSAHCMLVTDAG